MDDAGFIVALLAIAGVGAIAYVVSTQSKAASVANSQGTTAPWDGVSAPSTAQWLAATPAQQQTYAAANNVTVAQMNAFVNSGLGRPNVSGLGW